MRRAPSQIAERRLRVGNAEKLPGVVVRFEAAQAPVRRVHDPARAAGAVELLQGVGGVGQGAGPRVRVRKRAGVVQVGDQVFQRGGEIGGGLVEVQIGGVSGDGVPNLFGELDAVVQVAVRVQRL